MLMNKTQNDSRLDKLFCLSKADAESLPRAKKAYRIFQKYKTDISFLQRSELLACSKLLVSCHPKLAFGYIIWGSHLLATKRFKKAYKCAQKAINNKVESPKLIHELATLCFKLSNFESDVWIR